MSRLVLCVCFFVSAVLALEAGQKPRVYQAPESFTASFNVASGEGAAAAGTLNIQIDKYTPDNDRQAVTAALKSGGHDAFLAALRKAPKAGSIMVAGKIATIRWVQQQRTSANKRTITLVTDEPVLFVGGAFADAKPRAGYDVALVKFDIDDAGYNTNAGTMAAAARLQVDAAGNINVMDYATSPIKLISVTKKS